MEPLVNNLLGTSVILAVLWIAVILVRRSLRNLRGLGSRLDHPDRVGRVDHLDDPAASAENMRRNAEREVIELHQRWDTARRDLESLEPGQTTERAVRLARRHLDELVDQIPTGVQYDTVLSARTSVKALEVMAAERKKSR